MSAKTGLVSYTTLKGLHTYSKAISILAKYAPACLQKLDSHMGIATIPHQYR
jgi:hypothetical protein